MCGQDWKSLTFTIKFKLSICNSQIWPWLTSLFSYLLLRNSPHFSQKSPNNVTLWSRKCWPLLKNLRPHPFPSISFILTRTQKSPRLSFLVWLTSLSRLNSRSQLPRGLPRNFPTQGKFQCSSRKTWPFKHLFQGTYSTAFSRYLINVAFHQ